MKKIEVEIPDNIPEEDLAVIRKYSKELDKFMDWKEYIKYLSENNINRTFITKD